MQSTGLEERDLWNLEKRGGGGSDSTGKKQKILKVLNSTFKNPNLRDKK